MDAFLLNLAAQFLSDYSDRLGNDGCNDWHWPKGITEEQKRQVCGEEWAREYGTRRPPPNFIAVDNLAALLREEASQRRE